jgi:nicotinamide-nucleotide amidase
VKAVYLAIGTELTSGQITNRNAAWISSKLESVGIEVSWHLCVPDDRSLMRESMELAGSKAGLVFITGGLGPTTDDFTRDVVTEWWGERLEWHEPSWGKAVERLARRGIRAPESSRQQCWYPRGAVVLSNREGTADGFLLSRPGLSVFVLPGPPREIEAIWNDHIAAWLDSKYPDMKPIEPLRWGVLGRSEAQLGDLVEEAVRGSGLTTGYRATPPYVEVKVWIPRGLTRETPAVAAALSRLEAAIGPWTVTRGDEDLVEAFVARLERAQGCVSGAARPKVEIFDACTPGFLSERIWGWARTEASRLERLRLLGLRVTTGEAPADAAPALGLRIELGPLVQRKGLEGARVRVSVLRGDSSGSGVESRPAIEMEIPFPAWMLERQQRYAVEKLLTLEL